MSVVAQMKKLKDSGYVLLSIEKSEVDADRNLLYKYIFDIPEIRKEAQLSKVPSNDIGPGSFGALNFASAYHAPVSVSCDHHVHEAVRPILTELAKDLGLTAMQLIPDRLCFRTRAQVPESYHYDATSGAEDGDCFFGTIYNMNESLTQFFTCVPGTHKLRADLKGGAYNSTNDRATEYKQLEETVEIPPCHALVFFENIMHRVSGKKPREPILRKFVGFRLTNSQTEWLADENNPKMHTQGALHHKGGEIAPMYPRMYLVNHVDKLVQYANRLRPEMLTNYTFQSGKRKGTTISIPKLNPPSLQELGEMYSNVDPDRFKLRRLG